MINNKDELIPGNVYVYCDGIIQDNLIYVGETRFKGLYSFYSMNNNKTVRYVWFVISKYIKSI